MKKIDIICPLYNAEKYIKKLDDSLKMQKKVNITNIKYLLTDSQDNTEEILKNLNTDYEKIKKEEFSHSLTREKAALKSNADIIVFITQDVLIQDKLWCYYLTKDINDEIVACYSKQVTKYNNIEKYTREYNYPSKSFIKSKEDIPKLGLRTFFFFDASSAINANVFKKLNGYDGKNFMFSEDMYIAYKIIQNSYKIKYCADSVVYHSHNFTIKQLYNRYKATGRFFKENKYLNDYHSNKSGAGLAKYVLKRIIQERRFNLLFRFPFDMGARYLGKKAGER